MEVRKEFVAEAPLDVVAMAALLPDDERLLVRVLVRRAGDDGFAAWHPSDVVTPGDTVVIYVVDPADDAQLSSVNVAFERRHYRRREQRLWPDEAAAIAALLPRAGADLLELCCGGGRVTRHLVCDGNRVVGLDRAPELCAAAATDGGARYVVASADALPFAGASFDGTACFENSLGVLFGRQRRTVEEMVRVTRPGGVVVLGFRVVDGKYAPHGLHSYFSREGFLEVVQTFDAARAERLVDGIARVRGRRRLDGGARPWGGTLFYLALDVA